MRIGELAKATGTKAETIRYYEREGILPPADRTESNYRDYDASHADRLIFIRSARGLGFSLSDVRELLELADDRERSCEAVDKLAGEHLGAVNAKIADLKRMRDELSRMLTSCRSGTVGDCRIIESLRPH